MKSTFLSNNSLVFKYMCHNIQIIPDTLQNVYINIHKIYICRYVIFLCLFHHPSFDTLRSELLR